MLPILIKVYRAFRVFKTLVEYITMSSKARITILSSDPLRQFHTFLKLVAWENPNLFCSLYRTVTVIPSLWSFEGSQGDDRVIIVPKCYLFIYDAKTIPSSFVQVKKQNPAIPLFPLHRLSDISPNLGSTHSSSNHAFRCYASSRNSLSLCSQH